MNETSARNSLAFALIRQFYSLGVRVTEGSHCVTTVEKAVKILALVRTLLAAHAKEAAKILNQRHGELGWL